MKKLRNKTFYNFEKITESVGFCFLLKLIATNGRGYAKATKGWLVRLSSFCIAHVRCLVLNKYFFERGAVAIIINN